MNNKPQQTLTQLEEEPESGFMGCTYSEVVGSLQKGIAFGVFSAFVLAFVNFFMGAIVGVLVSIIVFIISIRNQSKNRAEKPLYFSRHLATYKNKKFIQPPRIYQTERNK